MSCLDTGVGVPLFVVDCGGGEEGVTGVTVMVLTSLQP